MDVSSRILIANNDEGALFPIASLLEREGYQCTTVQDGLEGIKALQVNEYDLLIAEIHMPGNEELELVQAMERYVPGLPVIIYTGHPTLRSAITSIQLPVVAYLIKPVQPEVLLHHVKTSIANYQASKRKEELLQQTIVYAWAIEETILVLGSTRSSFKSKKLAVLRQQLERILNRRQFDK